MEIHPLPTEEGALRRFVESLWLPYHRTLEAIVDGHVLADDVDLVSEEIEFRLDRDDAVHRRSWVAVADAEGPVDLAASGLELAGFVSTEMEESPTVFERPDRLVVTDIFVRERYRGSGTGRDLMERAFEHARLRGCAELALDVDVDNESAITFYETLGFETRRLRMVADADEF